MTFPKMLKCDKDFHSEDSLQRLEANIQDQQVVSEEPLLENRMPTLRIARNVMMSFTVRAVGIYMKLMFMLPPIPVLSKSVTKSFKARTVCMDMWIVFILPPTTRLGRSVTENVTARTVCSLQRLYGEVPQIIWWLKVILVISLSLSQAEQQV